MGSKLPVVDKALEIVNNVFNFFSADERRKRRVLSYEDNLKKAINLGEKHFDELATFLHFLDRKLDLKNPVDKKYYATMKKKFKDASREFKELT